MAPQPRQPFYDLGAILGDSRQLEDVQGQARRVSVRPGFLRGLILPLEFAERRQAPAAAILLLCEDLA